MSISVKNLSKSFAGKDFRVEVLKEADLEIAKGDTMAIIGESGIGKSTFLHILGTLDRPDGGRLLFDGLDLTTLAPPELAAFRNEKIGFVFQFHHLLPEFTALENVMMPGLINGADQAETKAEAETLFEKMGLMARMNNNAAELSGGEQQRVALARAVVLKPDILLADEPTGNLDEENSRRIHDLLMQLNDDLKMTMVAVTHNPELASHMKRKVTIIKGKIIETDSR